MDADSKRAAFIISLFEGGYKLISFLVYTTINVTVQVSSTAPAG